MIIALVGNKSDLYDNRAVSVEYAMRKKNDLACFMNIETSSYNDVDAIDQLFTRVAKEICS